MPSDNSPTTDLAVLPFWKVVYKLLTISVVAKNQQLTIFDMVFLVDYFHLFTCSCRHRPG